MYHRYLADAVHFISQETADRQLVANVDQLDKDGTLWVTLYDPKSSKTVADSINGDVIDEGLAMVPKKLKAWERASGDVLGALKKKQDVAKEERRGQWEYGDLTEDD